MKHSLLEIQIKKLFCYEKVGSSQLCCHLHIQIVLSSRRYQWTTFCSHWCTPCCKVLYLSLCAAWHPYWFSGQMKNKGIIAETESTYTTSLLCYIDPLKVSTDFSTQGKVYYLVWAAINSNERLILELHKVDPRDLAQCISLESIEGRHSINLQQLYDFLCMCRLRWSLL